MLHRLQRSAWPGRHRRTWASASMALHASPCALKVAESMPSLVASVTSPDHGHLITNDRQPVLHHALRLSCTMQQCHAE